MDGRVKKLVAFTPWVFQLWALSRRKANTIVGVRRVSLRVSTSGAQRNVDGDGKKRVEEIARREEEEEEEIVQQTRARRQVQRGKTERGGGQKNGAG